MKHILIIPFAILSITLNSYSQFSVSTEYNYLKLINIQKDKKLISSSVANANIVANAIILEEYSKKNTLFYNELSNSYYLINQFEKAFYYQIAQRVFYYNDSIASKTKSRFYDTGYKINLEKQKIDFIWNETSKKNFIDKKNNIKVVLELTTKLFKKPLTDMIYQLGLLLRKQKSIIPQWYQDWEYLTNIELKEKNKKEYLDYQSDKPLYTRLQTKKKRKLYSKAIKYYTKNHAFKHVDTLLINYTEKASFFEKRNLLFKKIAIIYHKII